jgi:hypothetical protein
LPLGFSPGMKRWRAQEATFSEGVVETDLRLPEKRLSGKSRISLNAFVECLFYVH